MAWAAEPSQPWAGFRQAVPPAPRRSRHAKARRRSRAWPVRGQSHERFPVLVPPPAQAGRCCRPCPAGARSRAERSSARHRLRRAVQPELVRSRRGCSRFRARLRSRHPPRGSFPQPGPVPAPVLAARCGPGQLRARTRAGRRPAGHRPRGALVHPALVRLRKRPRLRRRPRRAAFPAPRVVAHRGHPCGTPAPAPPDFLPNGAYR